MMSLCKITDEQRKNGIFCDKGEGCLPCRYFRNKYSSSSDHKKDDSYRRCPKCNSKMILMSGGATFEPDDEPYESGKYETIPDMDVVDKHLCAYYCIECEHIEVWEDCE